MKATDGYDLSTPSPFLKINKNKYKNKKIYPPLSLGISHSIGHFPFLSHEGYDHFPFQWQLAQHAWTPPESKKITWFFWDANEASRNPRNSICWVTFHNWIVLKRILTPTCLENISKTSPLCYESPLITCRPGFSSSYPTKLVLEEQTNTGIFTPEGPQHK